MRNGWEYTPRVRGTVLRFNAPPRTGIEFPEPLWPHCNIKWRSLYVTGQGLSGERPTEEGRFSYSSNAGPVLQRDVDPGELQFHFKFSRKTSLLGPSRAVLYISTSTWGDFDLYVQLRKADPSGKLLQNVNIPMTDLRVTSPDDVPLISPLKYLGPSGILRASNREISEKMSKPHWNTLSHKQRLPVNSKGPIRLEIDIWPTGIEFDTGEQLVLKVSGHFMGPAEFLHLQGTFPVTNEGEHTLWWGAEHASYIEVPLLATDPSDHVP
jgi:predicted acyl esterase